MLNQLNLLSSFLPSLARAHANTRTGWEAWPFSGFGTLGFWGLLTKVLFVGAIFLGICYLLRYLFKPGGPLRGDDWETIEEADARRRRESEGPDKPDDNSPGAS